MLEPQEIDALLISALYGELTPAEETRLETHLGSHPADKTALAALTSTREAVRASRILQVQLDPPQSVSALLLQEAARRAPKPVQQEGWFARLARSFMAHPAMAAAAMLVVVIGVATLVQNRKGDHFSESSAPAESIRAEPSMTDQSIVAGKPAKDTAEDRLDQGVTRTAADGSSAGSASAPRGDSADGFRVSLAESDERERKLEKQQAAVVDSKVSGAERKNKAEAPKQDPSAPRDVAGTVEDTTTATTKNTKAGTAKPSGTYMELRGADPSVKDFEATANGEAQQVDRAYATTPADDLSKENVNAVTPGPGMGGKGAATTGAAPATPPAGGAAAATKSPSRVESPKAPDTQVARKVDATPSRNQQAPVRPAPAPPPPATPKVAANSGGASAADKTANDPQLAWAREQHTAIVARVRAGDCKGAASIAVGLANRDLGYYKQNVASDRSVKECLAYIDNARERDQEQRAERSKAPQKRQTNEPAATKKAADQPTKPTATDAAH